MPNPLAYLALIAWPIVTIYFFKTKEIRPAILFSIFGGYMFLPVSVEIDFPGVPALDKVSIVTLSVLLCSIYIKKQRIGFFKLTGIPKILFIMLLLSPFLTALANKSPVGFLPGLTMYDGLSSIFTSFLFMSPFFLGRKFFSTEKDQIFLFKYVVIATLLYSIFILYEVRMSPQLHITLYGFFPHSFGQQFRDGGFRAVVFMGHGLWVAFFVCMSVIVASVLWRLKIRVISVKTGFILFYLVIVLILSKTLASLLYGLAAGTVIILFSAKMQARAAVIIAIIVISYPVLSIHKLFPQDALLEIATSISGPERSGSLAFRFENENILLEHAYQKPLFGWGGWGRNRVYDERTGKDISITDGKWVLLFGIYGWFGMIAEFGLIFVTILFAARKLKYGKTSQEKLLLSSHALLVSIILVDQIPNASIVPLYWLYIGSLFGRSESLTET